jgi:DNA-binding transcriptional MocR family regulator
MPTLDPVVTRWRPRLSRSGPRYLALVDAIAEGLATGVLQRGDRLPTQRDLASTLRLNLATVTRAIAEAERRGLVNAQQGRGTFVAEAMRPLPGEVLDLTLNLPPEPSGSPLPRRLVETTTRLLQGDGARALLRYPELGGSRSDRAAGARWVAARGFSVTPDQIVLADGADHALLLGLMALAPRGRRVLTEELCYPGFRTMSAMLGLPITGLAVDDDGLRPDALERAAADGPAILALTPTLHNPTTRTMPESRRREIAEIARRHHLVILEDDVYGFLPLDAPQPFAVLAAERTAYVTSFSKSFAPGLRIGYLAAPAADLAEQITNAAHATTCTPASLAAAVASRWIDDGVAADALAATRAELVRRDALASRMLPRDVRGHGTLSPHRWLELPAGWRGAEFVERARQHGVAVRGSDAFSIDTDPPEAVRFSISAAYDDATLERALLILAKTLREPHGIRPAVV